MADQFSVTLQQIVDEFHLEILHAPSDLSTIMITENDITRPGLQLMGFYEYFNPNRIQIIGKMEFAYLSTIDEKEREQHVRDLFSRRIACLCLTRGLPCFAEMLTLAKEYKVPVLRTAESTSHFTTSLLSFLNMNNYWLDFPK